MKLFQQLRALFRPQNEPIVAAPTGYSDEDFLSVMMEQARKRTQAEQAGRDAAAKPVMPGSLPTAA
ncbi:hypothetical protein [Hymenobacter cheonanensis]|uniref:hypothetical protein n=1 Tax=Hymenobacter sp. CA2-7 TaxID=3063993 RepID=UPI00271266A2|nr:hypothetical protein [Hymenobacter sp. CA2-7]MDO7887934.1 hypothetical protein [Hymenobacter sp. CA2-7]